MKPIKFDLPFNGTKLCTFDDLKNNLTAELLEPFRTGKLAKWLRVRKLDEQADAVDALLAADNEREVQSLKGLMELFDGETDENLLRAAIAERKQALPSVQNSNDEEVESLKAENEALKIEIEQLKNQLINEDKAKIANDEPDKTVVQDCGVAWSYKNSDFKTKNFPY
jgi:regulator of replication initiation timing